MRVSEQSRLAARSGYLQAAQERLDHVQQQLATGRRMLAASDDPGAATIALQHRENLAFETQMRRNLDGGLAFLNASEAALAGAGDALQRIRELTVQASNDTLGPQERQAVGAEVTQLIGQLAQAANTNFSGAYIFGGHVTQAPPYQLTGSPPSAVTYNGDSGARIRRISQQDAVAVNVTGPQAFGSMFGDLITLQDNLATGAPGTTISTSLTAIDAALNRVLDTRAEIGARSNRLESAQRPSEQTNIDLETLRSTIEEIDLPETITRFTAEQTSYEAALNAIGRTASMTLLNFLH